MATTGATGSYDGAFDGAVGPANSSESSTINPRMFASIHRYGSAEQPTKRGRVENMGDYLNSMNDTGNTPRPSPRTSRSPRTRSPQTADDDRVYYLEDRRRERSERRDDREEPIGMGFRLTACETSLKEHHSELEAHRVMLEQLGEEMKRQIADRDNHRQRLDAVFALVDQRFAESQQSIHETQIKFTEAQQSIRDTQVAAQNKFENITTTLNNVSQGLAARVEQLVLEVSVMRRESQSTPTTSAQPTPTASVPPTTASPAQPMPSPPPGMAESTPNARGIPASWNGTGSDPSASSAPGNAHASGRDDQGRNAHDARSQPREDYFIGSPLSGNRSAGGPSGHNGQAPNYNQSSGPGNSSNFAQNFDRASARPPPNYDRSPPPNYDRSPPPNYDRSPNFGGPFGNSGSSPAMAGAGTQFRPFDPRDWTTDGKKISKELKTFDGDLAAFDTWRMRVRNHFVGANCNYSRIFELIESNKIPIRWAQLANTHVEDLPYLDWQWIATHLWTFTGNFLSDAQLTRRAALVGGEEFNGLEYWRALYSENVGGSTQLANLERGHFIAFPNCPNIGELEPHLKQWIQLKNRYGHGLPEEHLIGMLWSIIPEHMKEEIKKQRDLVGQLDAQINWVFGEIAERTDNKLSKWNLSKLQRQLKSQPKNTTGIHAIGTNNDENAVQPPPVPDMATFTSTMERTLEKMVNAALTRTGRTQARTPPGSRSGSNGSQRAGRRIPSASFKG